MMNILLNQLKMKNPQMASQIQNMISNGGNPMDLFKQITNGYSPEKMNSLFDRAKQFGVPNDVIEKLQNNGVNTK